jgi:hypothetical protein
MDKASRQSLWARYSRGDRLQKLFFVVLILVAALILAIKTYFDFPLRSGRDWLNIFADVGQFVGGLAIIGIILEIYKYSKTEQAEKQNRIPILGIGRSIRVIDSCPEGGVICLNEPSRENLPTLDSLEKTDQYREMWSSMGTPVHGNYYLKIDISNDHFLAEANIVSLQLQLKLKYWGENERQEAEALTFWTPAAASSFKLAVGKSDSIYVRCGKLISAPGLRYISGEILDYRCTTARQDTFYGTGIGFETVFIPRQSLQRNNHQEM